MDIIGDLAYPLMLDLNCSGILGIPQPDWHPNFTQWTESMSLVADLDITPIAYERGMLAIAGLAEFFRNWITACRAGSRPADKLIGMLIKEGDRLSEEELLANCILMFTVGHSSTVNLIGIAMRSLLEHPAQLRLLAEDPSLIEMAISEILRYDSPVQGVSRTALSDIELSDKTIHRGEKVICIIGAANRDPARFPEPDNFDIRRRPNPHLSFGYGIHTCIGKWLRHPYLYRQKPGPTGNGNRCGHIGTPFTRIIPGNGFLGVGRKLPRARPEDPAGCFLMVGCLMNRRDAESDQKIEITKATKGLSDLLPGFGLRTASFIYRLRRCSQIFSFLYLRESAKSVD